MKFLRTVSTRRLLAMIAGLVLAAAAGTAIAVAAGGPGPLPPAKPLAQAIHQGLAAPSVSGITAQISFTNHLIDSTNIQGSDPILTGASGRLWLSSDHRLRLELQSNNGDAQVVVSGGAFWIYDPSSNTVYTGQVPKALTSTKNRAEAIPTIAQIQRDLQQVMTHVNVGGAIPSDVAGHAAYTVRVSPKHDGGLLGAAEFAWDAARGVPLRFAVYARGDNIPVLELKASDISYGRVSRSVFRISPPRGAKVVRTASPATTREPRHAGRERRHAKVAGVAAVARHVQFKLLAPKTLVGLPRRSVSLLDWGGTPAALVSYGQNLGGIAVIEQPAKSGGSLGQSAAGDRHRGLNLPTVSINGATGQELDTALGTMVRFTRGGVTYTVLGSVPAAAADAAARAL
jgi:outer membrane lipoprotein-sorting protein